MNASSLLTRFSIPAIVLLKVFVISYIFFGDRAKIYFGEKSTFAAETAEEAKPESNDSNPIAQPSGGEKKERRGFLDDLLTLPTINTDDIKKDELGRYLTLMERKQSQVENRLTILKSREQQLKNLESSVDAKLKKLEEELEYFQQTLQKEKQLQGDRLSKLVEFYQKMEPKKAAAVFEKLDRDLVVSLFNSISQKQTTQILSLMNPDRSVELSEYYGRIRSGKEYELLKEVNFALRKEFEECKGLPTGIQ